MLILDRHESHVSRQFLDYAQKHNIIVYTLPPHSTYLTQPLDVDLLGSLAHYYRQGLDKFFRIGNQGLEKENFEPLISQARQLAYMVKNVKSAWKKAGVVLFDSQKVLDKLRRPESKVQGGGTNQWYIDYRLSSKTQAQKRHHLINSKAYPSKVHTA